MKNRVVITGLGPVTQLGIGIEAFTKHLKENRQDLITKIPNEIKQARGIKANYYVPAVDIGKSFGKNMFLLSQENSRVASLAAQLAIENAHLNISEDNEIPVIFGIGIGDLSESFKNYVKFNATNRLDRFISPKSMPNAPVAWIAINNHLHGGNFTINAACASGTYAIGEAYRKIADGYADTVVCGGMEWLKEKSFVIPKSFEVLGILDNSKDGRPRPFQKTRTGLLFNEGTACALVLEDYEKAKQRGATIFAEICGFETSMDATSIVAIENSGKNIERMLRKLIKNEPIDYYNAHGTGTVLNDDVESRVFKNIFGLDKSKQPLINSTKGLLGHTFGASGAIEAVICAIALKEGYIHSNIIDSPIENLNLVEKPLSNEIINSAVSTSFGFGGHNGALLFKKVGDDNV
ncbi:MAG: beta-ketoacyl-[acyl-carrier-protein] synthase family protein [Streptococcaceae bacterium]|nr:beta-ketoacyl-[acyl-carrier-protein] synthase family protein [Streptococcaceae bacterium]